MSAYNVIEDKEKKEDVSEFSESSIILKSKQNLKKAIEFMKDLEFQESEISKIYDKANHLFKNKHFEEISLKLKQGSNEGKDLEAMLKEFSDSIKSDDLANLIKVIAKDEEFLNFIQDLLLDKLL